MPNTHWHAPQRMIFESETMRDWLDEPQPSDLPSTFLMRDARSWKNAATRLADEKRWVRACEDRVE